MIDENLQRYIVSYLNLCKVCNKYNIVEYEFTCRRCKVIMCKECSKKSMIRGSDDSETICRYCKECFYN